MEEKLQSYPPILQREFIKLDKNNDAFKFRIMQWNMLASALCFPEDKIVSPIYDWDNYRLWRTIQEMSRYDSDILCIEEADVYEEIKPYMHSLG